MNLLIPLGLLGLLSLLVLLLIYILKPNYQQKVISSTFVWKLSLKYKKKRVPISKLRNLLIILCQILILVAAAFIISKPANVTENPTDYNEKIIVIDASASMFAATDGQSRFARAKTKAAEIATEAFDKNSVVSVIYAGLDATYVTQRASATERDVVLGLIDELDCTYGKADMEGSVELAEEMLQFNPDSEVILLTGTDYTATNKRVRVENVGVDGEWNAAILGVETELENGFYTITVEVASYGMENALVLECDVVNANRTGNRVPLPAATVYCSNDETFKVVYTGAVDTDRNWGENTTPVVLTDDMRIFSFEQMFFSIDTFDCYPYDNEYYLYGGNPPEVRVAYCSTEPNNFYGAALLQLVDNMAGMWSVEVKTFTNSFPDFESEEGKYDIYIFEHKMPDNLPKDGIVFMVDPDKSADAGFTVSRKITIPNWEGDGNALAPGAEHPILDYIDVTSFHVSQYTEINQDSMDVGFETLMYYEGNPVFFVKDEPEVKLAVFAVDMAKSNTSLAMYFPMMMANFFNYWLPATFNEDIYYVYDTVRLNGRGESLDVGKPDNESVEIDELPSEFVVNDFGTYTVEQDLIGGKKLVEQFYVRIDPSLSYLNRQDDIMLNPLVEEKPKATYEYLLIYFAAAMVALLFIEWWLQSRSGI